MARWVIETFGGLAPKISAKKLSDELATQAINVEFETANLAPLNDVAYFQDLSSTNTQSLYKYNTTWLTSDNERHYVGTLLPNDTDEKIYFSDYPSYPKVQSGGNSYRLGLPKPGALTSVLTSAGDPDETLQETWRYVCSFVDAFGFEGPSSNPTAALEVGSGGSVTLTLPATPTGNYNLGTGAMIRVYRSLSGTAAADFQFLIDLPIGTNTHLDSTPSYDLEEAITEYDNYAAPDETSPFGALRGLVELPGNILAGFTNNTVHVTKPNRPHAWPYEFSTQHDIVGIVPVQGGLFVLTNETPYMLIGSDPSSMIIEPVLSDQACISKNSIVDMGGYAMYASPDGLCMINGAQVEVVTSELITPTQWRGLFNPQNIKAFNYEGKYVAFTSAGNGFTFDIQNGKNALTFHSGKEVVAAHRVAEEDTLYVLYKDSPTAPELLGKWNKGSALTFTWQSKLKQHSKSVAYSYAKVYGEGGYATLTILAGDQTLVASTVPINELIRIPSAGKYPTWQIRIESDKSVEMVGLFDNTREVI